MRNDAICAYFDSFGDDLKAARKALDLTRNKLAEAVGIDPRYLANIENICKNQSHSFLQNYQPLHFSERHLWRTKNWREAPL